MTNSKVSLKHLKSFLIEYKFTILICALLSFIGIVLGVYAELKNSTFTIFSADELSISKIIVGDYNVWQRFFYVFGLLLLSFIIVTVFNLNKFLFVFSYIYLGYQSYLFGSSITTVIALKGIRGAFSTLFFLLPINLLILFSIMFTISIYNKRKKIAKQLKLMTKQSYVQIMPLIIFNFLLMVLISIISAVILPLVLRSVIIISY